ncbi:MAG: TPM domain-containing protein [Proteiniphilum sp.]|nr:TPM domain-containing protein [Proteiniphilum sp.]
MLNKKELANIVNAIRMAENKTSAEIRVCVAKSCKIDPLEAAYNKFVSLKMDETKLRNSVLIYVAPRDHKTAIIGDEAINEIAKEGFWDDTLSGMITLFKSNDSICEGICHGVEAIGELIKIHFPVSEDDINELSDEVIIDED